MIAAVLAAALIAGPPPPAPTAAHPVVVNGDPISRGWLRHWADQAQREGGDRASARAQAARFLIEWRWLHGEAVERGVVVSRRAAARELRRQRRDVGERWFRRFLRSTGQTVGDMRLRVQIDLQSDRLRAHATEAATTAEEQQALLGAFIRDWRAQWRPLTACRPPWVSELECGITSSGRTRRSPAPARRASRSGDRGGASLSSSSRASFRRVAPAS